MNTVDPLTAQYELEKCRAYVARGMQDAQLLGWSVERRYLSYQKGWLTALSNRPIWLSRWLRQRYHPDATGA